MSAGERVFALRGAVQAERNDRESILASTDELRLATGEAWGYDAAKKTITYPHRSLSRDDKSTAMGRIFSELAHINFSGMPKESEIDNPAFSLLWKAVDRVRSSQASRAREQA